jgi:hypothetical protein
MRRQVEDRRQAARYRFDSVITFEDGSTGQTRDMSTSGIFFETNQIRSVGDFIRFSVTLNGSTVNCGGQIVRVELINNHYGVAVALSSYEFC